MPIIPSQKNPLVALKAFRTDITTRTGITNFDRDSKVGSITDVLIDEMLKHREDMAEAFYANHISNAVGEQLDGIGDRLGLPRRLPFFADVTKPETLLLTTC